MSSKRPGLRWYPGDLRRDVALQSCSIGARGLWYELLWLMHDGEPYGHLSVSGKPLSPAQAAALVGATPSQFKRLAAELLAAGIPGVRADGCWYSRRMVRDEEKRVQAIEDGARGGNAKLGVSYNQPGFVYLATRADGCVKVGISVSPEQRIKKIRQSLADASVSLIATAATDDMGQTEAEIHAAVGHLRTSPGAEWFRLSAHDLEHIKDRWGFVPQPLKGPGDGTPKAPPANRQLAVGSGETNCLSEDRKPGTAEPIGAILSRVTKGAA